MTKPPMTKLKYGFIGAGRMATALAGGLVESEGASGQQIAASDPDKAIREAFAQAIPGALVTDDNAQVARNCSVVLLAVKPQVMETALASLALASSDGAGSDGSRPLVVSIAAGIPLRWLESHLPPGTRVIRVMPNTPCLVGQGASGYSLGSAATVADGQSVEQMLQAVGMTFKVPEPLLDGVTGLSGSGPAFVYSVIEALAEGGIEAGLPKEIADSLAAQTVAGAAKMVLEMGDSPAKLRDAVTSPGGTTLAGLQAMEQKGLGSALRAAVRAATLRARELGAKDEG